MRKSLFFWQVAGFLFTGVAGVLLHFLFDWTNNNAIIALFSAVNESIFEHMKLLFYPMLIFSLIQSRYIADKYDNFWCAKLIGILVGLIIIPVLYYSYTGILGVSADWFNIVIFYIAAAASYITEAKILSNKNGPHISSGVSKAILCGVAVLFIILTFMPPKIPLFKDPLSNHYGYKSNRP